MRFAKLMLERYGRFEDCELSFRAGQPDLHVIYGPNEAGKTTSMAAVSDLLFGFGTTSPYKFLFDYPLLRIGAVLEEDDQRLPIRRRKANAGSLVGADDKPIDEAPLLAMLRGQSRDTFRLSFSLDQEGLRKGGQAMVQARDDLGQALFAAGSNLTDVTAEAGKLENAADAIWGKRASNRRSYTIAEREFREKTRAVRDLGIKPKDWADARNAEAETRRTLGELERQRDSLSAESRKLERLRRVGAFVRTRASLLHELADHAATVVLTTQAEASCEQALSALNQASRDLDAASALKAEAEADIALITLDEKVIRAADRLEHVIEKRGAATKAVGDLQRLTTEHDLLFQATARLRGEAGLGADAVPGRLAVTRLREIAKQASDARVALGQISKSEVDLRAELAAVQDDTIIVDAEHLSQLRTAITGALALGNDVDSRCSEAATTAQRAQRAATLALEKLLPWDGDINRLAGLVPPADDELQHAIDAIRDLDATIADAGEQRRRLTDEASVLAVEIDGLRSADGAVSDEDLSRSRDDRNRVWEALRAEIALGELGPLAPANAAEFDTKLGEADHLADRRYAKAEDSGRLAHLLVERKAKLVQARQAQDRAAAASAQREQADAAWSSRLEAAGLVTLEPSRMRVWLSLRLAALDLASSAETQVATTAREHDRRTRAIGALRSGLGLPSNASASGGLAELLAQATAVLADLDTAAARNRDAALERKRIEKAITDLRVRRRDLDERVEAAGADWAKEVSGWSFKFEISTSEFRLDLFDEVRTASDKLADLERRIEGIERDSRDYTTLVDALSDELSVAAGTSELRVDAMRSALLEARSTQTRLRGLRDEAAKRGSQETEANARLDAAKASLAAAMTELGTQNVTAIASAIDASRLVRRLREEVSEAERQIEAAGDGYGLEALLTAFAESDPDQASMRAQAIERELADLNTQISEVAAAHGDARRAFLQLENSPAAAIDAATDAASALAEMGVQAEEYILRRVQAVTLRWAIERYREEHQDPMLERASTLFSRLTLGRYAGLRVDYDTATPRLLGVSRDGRSVVEVGAMSEGTTDQLFLSLRLAAVEQSVMSGVRLPFLADDLFVNFDDDRSRAGLEVLAELARTTQVLFFTHHAHLAEMAREVVGTEIHSQCVLT